MTRNDAQRGSSVSPAFRSSVVSSLRCTTRARGFTLLELLVSVAIITVLVSLLFPAIRSAVAIARSRQCQAGQRAVAFDFQIFADDSLHGSRGSDASGSGFSLASFMDAQFQIGEFWNWGNVDEITMPDAEGHDPMRCPEMSGPITLFRGRAAHEGGVGPLERLSYGFNIRLHQMEYIDSGGRPRARQYQLSSAILSHGNIPLMWDIDAATASVRNVTPLLSGPSMGSTGVYAGNRYWFPASRHHGKINFLFIDGHAEESDAPLSQSQWDWDYTPPTR